MDEQTEAEIRPYYVMKAAEALEKAKANPDADPSPLARWACEEHEDGAVLVTADGRIVGQAVYRQGMEGGAYYITECDDLSRIGYEVSYGRLVCGERTVVVRWSEVAQGADWEAEDRRLAAEVEDARRAYDAAVAARDARIRQRIAGGWTGAHVARTYGLSTKTVSQIRNR